MGKLMAIDIINKKFHDLEPFRDEFLAGAPFPHLVLDDFLTEDFFSTVTSALNERKAMQMGKSFSTSVEMNKSISLNSEIPVPVQKIVASLNSDEWIENFRRLTGIKSLLATKHGNTKLANYHEMNASGFLGSHVDHSHEPETGTPHVLNIIVYLSDDWDSDFGGNTLLFNRTGSRMEKRVEYKSNRALAFLHTPYSFHGVDRIVDGLEVKRRNLYIDYYASDEQPFTHMQLPFPNNWFKHRTTFRLGSLKEHLAPKNLHYTKALMQYHINRLMS
ncbi:2OG-Fe(II) oxygenase [Alphaproteobacteria bacterium]|nr:2OG-Fe(II) oxygenase [Alphaproteobacteria bacterium]